MFYIIVFFGVTILTLGSIILVKPESILDLFSSNADSLGLFVLAIVSRLILGSALIMYAPDSIFPDTFQVIGWLAVVAAVVFLGIGRSRFSAFLNWAIGPASNYARIAGVVGMGMGGFLLYAVL